MRVGILQFVAQLLEVSGEREREGLVGGKAGGREGGREKYSMSVRVYESCVCVCERERERERQDWASVDVCTGDTVAGLF